jgi:hypothetical protein
MTTTTMNTPRPIEAYARECQERAAIAWQASRDAAAEYKRSPSPGMRAIAIAEQQRSASLSRAARILQGIEEETWRPGR